MSSSIEFDTKNLGLFIVYIEVPTNIEFLCYKIVFALAKSVNPDEMPRDRVFTVCQRIRLGVFRT